jgi:glutamate dehydrogenase
VARRGAAARLCPLPEQIRLGFDWATSLQHPEQPHRHRSRVDPVVQDRFYLARKLTADDLEDKQRVGTGDSHRTGRRSVLNEDRILRRYWT